MIMTINGIKIGNTINYTINGVMRKRTFKFASDAKELYNAILIAKENPTEKNLNTVELLFSSRKKVAYLNDLEIDDNGIYLKGFNTPMPELLIKIFEDYNINNFPTTALKNFWINLMLNPDKRVHESAFDFINKHDYSITDNGYLVTYKAVYLKTDNLKYFVDTQHDKVRKEWKTNPKRYVVYQNNETLEYDITKEETFNNWDVSKKNVTYIGNLNGLYLDDSTTIYTDMHTETMNIVVGSPVKMERTECDSDPLYDCSYGLHVGATRYVESFAKNNSRILICLVNPKNIVAIPNYDNSKMRVCEYYPIGLANNENGKIEIIEQSYFENDYSSIEKEELEKLIEEYKVSSENIKPAMGAEEENRESTEILKIMEARSENIYNILA